MSIKRADIMSPIQSAIMLLVFIFMTGSAQSSLLIVGSGDANYPSIQRAIDDARPGDIIEVDQGIYNENVTIDKALILRGINGPIIDSMGRGSPLSLTCGGTVIEGFSLRNSSEAGSGINIILEPLYISNRGNLNTSGVTIRDNVISNSYNGIAIKELSSNVIEGNVIKNNGNVGVDLMKSWDNMLSGNMIVNNSDGLSLEDSSRNVIENNSFSNNPGSGILLRNYYLSEYGPYGFSDNNIIRRNVLENSKNGISLLYAEWNNISNNKLIANEYGIYLDGSANNSISNNDYINNTVNYTSRNRSRDKILNQTRFEDNFFGALFGALSLLALLVLLFAIVLGLMMGVVVGLIVDKVLKRQSPGLIRNAVIGMIGFNIGFFAGLLLISDLSIAFILALLISVIFVLLCSKPKGSGI
jgi:parallel beta-helix repeat protein